MTDNSSPIPSSDRPLAAVTGASSGIGLEVAIALARRGYDLIINAEDDDLDAAAAAVRSAGAQVRSVRGDLRHAAEVDQLHAAIVADGRPLGVMALNAGVGK